MSLLTVLLMMLYVAVWDLFERLENESSYLCTLGISAERLTRRGAASAAHLDFESFAAYRRPPLKTVRLIFSA